MRIDIDIRDVYAHIAHTYTRGTYNNYIKILYARGTCHAPRHAHAYMRICARARMPARFTSRHVALTLSVTKYSQDHRASFRLVQGRPGCGCCVATERATPTITISAKVVLKMQLKCSPERECNYTNRLMGHY